MYSRFISNISVEVQYKCDFLYICLRTHTVFCWCCCLSKKKRDNQKGTFGGQVRQKAKDKDYIRCVCRCCMLRRLSVVCIFLLTRVFKQVYREQQRKRKKESEEVGTEKYVASFIDRVKSAL